MTRHLGFTTLVAAAALAASFVSGDHRRPALVGSLIASVTAVGSLVAMGRFSRSRSSVSGAMAVMVVAFLLRIVLVALGTVLVARAGENIFAFVIAFFVPYFIFAAIEGSYLHGLSRGTGPTA